MLVDRSLQLCKVSVITTSCSAGQKVVNGLGQLSLAQLISLQSLIAARHAGTHFEPDFDAAAARLLPGCYGKQGTPPWHGRGQWTGAGPD